MDYSEGGRYPVTVTEWPQKVVGWDLHDVVGWLVAVPAGTVVIITESILQLHAAVLRHDGNGEQQEGRRPPEPMPVNRWDRVHPGWEHCTKYGKHVAWPRGTEHYSGEYIDHLARTISRSHPSDLGASRQSG